MEALYLLVAISVLIVAIALLAFFMMSDSGQFDDLDSPAARLLRDDDAVAVDGQLRPPGILTHINETDKTTR
jgi:cbb3-type cytochrome oxidase maturation protein